MTFPFIAGIVFLYFILVYPSWLWRNRMGFLWMIGGAAAVYMPMVPHMFSEHALSHRLSSQAVFFNPDGSISFDPSLWAHQLGRSFGSILYYPDRAPWMTSTGRPICVPLEACLFGIGPTYLLLSWRSASTFVVLATIGMSIFLGSVLLPTPPSYYHYFVAMVFVAFISAVACDRLLALTDSWSWKPRLVCAPLAAGVLIAIVDIPLRLGRLRFL